MAFRPDVALGDPLSAQIPRSKGKGVSCRGHGLGHTSGPDHVPQRMGNSLPPLTTTVQPWASPTMIKSFCALS